jgi:hypothetical protein
MKRLAFALGLVAATALAAPLAAQSRNDGPWWDPANTGTRSGTTDRVDNRSGTIYNDGRVYDSRTADGQWRRVSRDRNGNYIYVRTVRDRNGNVVQERARRDSRGRMVILDRRVVSSARRSDDRVYDRNRNDRDRNNDGYEDGGYGRDRNDRWDQNNGHDNGKHNGQYKNKNKGKGRR